MFLVNRIMSNRWKLFIFLLVLMAVTLWLAAISYPGRNLRVIACDVGQGDAFLVIRGKTEILVDGGPGNKVINCLNNYLPFWDREIEVIVLTHPQADHYSGLIEVFENYSVKYFLANALDSSSSNYSVLKSLVGGSQTVIINPTSSVSMRLDLIYLDILSPSSEFLADNSVTTYEQKDRRTKELYQTNNGVLGAYTSEQDPNQFSIVAMLSYGEFDALFTGDIDNKLSDDLAEIIKQKYNKPLEYIKVPHHGSKNGLSQSLLGSSNWKIGVISVGKNNSYGHPHQEVLKILGEKDIKILRTDEMGDVVIATDGKNLIIPEN
ncbi:hypothetical protein A3A76_04465 [Candidatus Woesebacteria bacterium RIFCSPLOWO2_01_FULL_39_23]|uniref:Metallo-beta-lactamase domain-containing protein n=1 Tax=Candidatus Woesebacteria bacterium RIFCSPHIGHO2_01_FULL_40_22 TaxID=1802499 RepID=A0A1F7YI82_9BACT|nr:MAG: hypothetical protein A2141_02075 [Candidatus Woesebacteria bacterium RBG_16_40_11]OGM27037.1 MAG: hypothetical protein A2628_02745 [Candidatus Woesebacteria bacterium RIFCSPHIGHO2_01_FULL_40_22]OGM36511.1 MAG: hypothetical protein A3E41_00630 [Candidatus Woesebacteria bacterium RIFCSPHIGHO2_12_FULL_38_9]OGM63272.1 MAG: hypothetical protein A3A76_04465 [Candidatus Woesebacteria bacterium RIFCSPLOWO2_01_FULL_39_23]